MRRRWPRLKIHGVSVYRLREGIDEDLAGFGEDGFIEMNSREDRPDIAKVVAAIHLIGRRREVATLACIADVLDWPVPRVRTALSALLERRVVRVKKIHNPYPPMQYRSFAREKAPLDPSDFVPAGNGDDPRGDEPVAQQPEESPVAPATAEKVLRMIHDERSGREEAA
jgi:hypothetical protein